MRTAHNTGQRENNKYSQCFNESVLADIFPHIHSKYQQHHAMVTGEAAAGAVLSRPAAQLANPVYIVIQLVKINGSACTVNRQ